MPTYSFNLFGRSLTVDTAVPFAAANWGGLTNTLSVTLSGTPVSQVRIKTTGQFPFAPALVVDVTFNASADHGRLVLKDVVSADASSKAVVVLGTVAKLLSNDAAETAPFALTKADFVADGGLGFFIRAGTAARYTDFILDFDRFDGLLAAAGDYVFRRAWFSFDFADDAHPAGLYRLEGEVDFQLNDHAPVDAQQTLRLDHLRKSILDGVCQWSLRVHPTRGHLLIGSDSLRSDTSDAVLYQHAMVNGMLSLHQSGKPGSLVARREWLPHAGGAGDAALLALHVTDEHGLPVALCSPAPFRLQSRIGVSSDSFDSIVLVNPEDGVPHPVQIRALEIDRLDGERLVGRKRDAPVWDTDSGTPLADIAPAELHGLARGLRLARTGAVQDRHWEAELATTSLPRDDGTAPALVLNELRLKTPEQWTAMLQMAEETVNPGTGPVLQRQIAERKAPISAAPSLAFPMVDVAWTICNLAPQHPDLPVAPLAHAAISHAFDQLARFDAQFVARDTRIVGAPLLSDDGTKDFRHVKGTRGQLVVEPDFTHVFSNIAVTAAKTASTAKPLPQLKPPASMAAAAAGATTNLNYMHGGGEFDGVGDNLKSWAPTEDLYRNFARAWLTPKNIPGDGGPPRDAFTKIRALLKLDYFDSSDTTALYPDSALDWAGRLGDELAGGFLEDLFSNLPESAEIVAMLVAWLSDASPEEILDEIAGYFLSPDDYDVEFGWIARWYMARPDHDLFRRLVDVFDPRNAIWLKANLSAAEAADLAQQLFGGLPKIDLSGLEGFLSSVRDGLSDDYGLLARLWQIADAAGVAALEADLGLPHQSIQADRVLALFARLRTRLGPVLTSDVYARLLTLKDEADAVASLMREELNRIIGRLADIRTEPPEYFVLNRRFGLEPQQTKGGSVWNHVFDFCRQGAMPWLFFLNTDTTIVVKVGTRQTIADVLNEVHNSYRDDARGNPLMLPNEDLASFLALVDPEVRDQKTWVGAFVVRPTVDLSSDTVVKAMTGLNTISALYLAIGGAKPNWGGEGGPNLDIIARIKETAEAPDPKSNSAARDADLTLTKFDVTVRNSKIAQGEIACKLDLVELFGKEQSGNPESKKSMLVRAVLPPAKDTDPARTFEFGCYFDQPLEVDVNVLCVKSFKFRSLKAVKHGGDVALDIDADVMLTSGAGMPFKLGADTGNGDPFLRLQNFRIRLPDLGPQSLRLGAPRTVAFDFPAVSIRLPSMRTFNLAGLDIIPTGLGFLRLKSGEASDGMRNLLSRFSPVHLPGIEYVPPVSPTADYRFVSVELTLDLGKLPILSGSGSFLLDLVLGIAVEGGVANSSELFVGIGGFEADHLKIDLFRIVTLEIAKLVFSHDYQAGLTTRKPIGLLLAEDIRLKILDWSLLEPGDKLSFAYMNYASPSEPNDKSWLVAYQSPAPKGGFLQIYGALIGKGLSFKREFYDLLLGKLDQASDVLKGVFDTGAAKLVNADVDGSEPWVFAVTFGLRKILDRCALVMQDGRYYGIRLSADWVPKLFDGADNISLAYIPGDNRALDRFRVALRVPKLDLVANMRSGEIALEWGVNQDFLVDIGFPWRSSQGYDWFRAFSVPAGAYEVKFGFYFEKRTHIKAQGTLVTLGAGVALYAGYFFGCGNGIAWIRAGIGVFAVLEARITLNLHADVTSLAALKNFVEEVDIVGAIGIFAYGEGGIDIWILSARFRVSAQASITCIIVFRRAQPTALTYVANLSVGYSGSVSVGCGWFSWTFSVSGSLSVPVSGRLLLG